MHDLGQAYALMLRICGAGIVIDALERMVTARKYRDDGLFSWVVLRQRLAILPGWWRLLADRLFQGAGPLMAVLTIRIAAVVVVVLDPVGSPAFSVGLTVLVVTHLYIYVRTSGMATIGADHMTLVVCGGSWLATVVAGGTLAARAGMWFVAAQSCLGYAVAGIAKLRAPKWRSGEAVVLVLSTYTNGNPGLHALVRSRRWLAWALCWSTMLWETTFPLVLVVPRFWMAPLLAVGVLFHASLAALMGLNLFLFAFPSTYVALWAITH
jgi:hypothetical protein